MLLDLKLIMARREKLMRRREVLDLIFQDISDDDNDVNEM